MEFKQYEFGGNQQQRIGYGPSCRIRHNHRNVGKCERHYYTYDIRDVEFYCGDAFEPECTCERYAAIYGNWDLQRQQYD